MSRFGAVLVFVVAAVVGQRVPENPCPNYFAYRNERGAYYGQITIPYFGSKDLNLAVNISMPGLFQNAKAKLELVTPSENILSAQELVYRLNFPFNNIIPRITQITFNDRNYCYGPAEPLGTSGVTNLWSSLVYKINQYTYSIESGLRPQNQQIVSSTTPFPSGQVLNNKNDNSNNNNERESCGIVNEVQPLVIKGEKTVHNEFPWLVAMFHHQGVSYEFQCTANLVSERHVVTAAHCVWFYKAPLINKENILLVLGSSDISHWASTGALIRTALEVTAHPNYKQDTGHCDIAVIKMNEEVPFKPSVRPICLWSGDTNLKTIVGTHGTVAGWGKSENKQKPVSLPRKVSMPIVSQENCLRSNLGFKNLTSELTFCAGNRDGSGPCNGDSGAGMVMKKNGRWYLRGLVSTAIKNRDFSCDLNEYLVFSDVAKLRDWIWSVINT